MMRRTVRINNETFTLTELQPYGFSIGVRQWRKPLPKEHFILQTVHTTFDKKLFEFPHTPIVIEDIAGRTKFSRQTDLRVLNCPIKFPGALEYRIPKELSQFDEAIAKCIAYEHAINENVCAYYAYITIDQGIVEGGRTQRTSGCHCDGFQGARIYPKLPISRTYSAYDHTPTIFYGQAFQTDHLDEAKHDFFSSFDEQADETQQMFFPDYSIILSGAYTVHRSKIAAATGYRTFFRLHYDMSRFDQLGNTHNPMFEYKWNMMTRNVRSYLRHKPLHHPNAF